MAGKFPGEILVFTAGRVYLLRYEINPENRKNKYYHRLFGLQLD